jgi:hypothetical protein
MLKPLVALVEDRQSLLPDSVKERRPQPHPSPRVRAASTLQSALSARS